MLGGAITLTPLFLLGVGEGVGVGSATKDADAPIERKADANKTLRKEIGRFILFWISCKIALKFITVNAFFIFHFTQFFTTRRLKRGIVNLNSDELAQSDSVIHGHETIHGVI